MGKVFLLPLLVFITGVVLTTAANAETFTVTCFTAYDQCFCLATSGKGSALTTAPRAVCDRARAENDKTTTTPTPTPRPKPKPKKSRKMKA